MYRGVIQPHKRTLLTQQVSVISRPPVMRQDTYELSGVITSRWKRNRLQRESSTTSVISDDTRGSSISSYESSTSELSQRNTQKKVTFCLNKDLTIHEYTDENESVFEEGCTMIANPESVDEIDVIVHPESISEIDVIANLESVDEIDVITNPESVNEIDEITNPELVNEIDVIANPESVNEIDLIANPESVNEIDKNLNKDDLVSDSDIHLDESEI